jgi:hypothetical protein
VGGVRDSDHLTGEAVDIQYLFSDGSMDNIKIWDAIQELHLPWDQLINEFSMAWVHVSHRIDRPNRGQVLTIK